MDTFYLGTHEPSWLTRLDIPLFISRRRLARLKTLPRAIGKWALDSGGFSERPSFWRRLWRFLNADLVRERSTWRDTE